MARTPVPTVIAARVLFRSDRTCCVCRQRGKPVQIHHVDGDPSAHDELNLAVLCFDCHRDTQVKGGFDRKLDASQVILYRDDWYRRVEQRRGVGAEQEGDTLSGTGRAQILEARMKPSHGLPDDTVLPPGDPHDVRLWDAELEAFVRSLPQRRRDAYRLAQVGWDTGITSEMIQASRNLMDALTEMSTALAKWYPDGHFGDQGPAEYMRRLVRSRYEWHRALLTPNGQAGTGTGAMAVAAVIEDVERAVAELVSSLTSMREDFNYTAWRAEWSTSA